MPKTLSAALYLELLDETGSPTWKARDVQQLVQLAKARQQGGQHMPATSASRAAEQQASSSVSESESSDGEFAANGHEEGNQRHKNSSNEEEVDVDTLLAMAAAEVGCLECVCDTAAQRNALLHGRPALQRVSWC